MDLSTLNPQQHEAVTVQDGAVLVLAGPGSGKTRVLTHRIAYLIAQGIAPYRIIAVTFTNKAASEMIERVKHLTQDNARAATLRIGTFHSLCARILRREADTGTLSPYTKHYQIYDTDDQLNIVKRVVDELGVNLKRLDLTPNRVLYQISGAKNELITPAQYPRSTYEDEVVSRIYEHYQARLQESNAMDFDDLIMNTVELFRSSPSVRAHYQDLFQYVLVDEFQDTNMAQYELIRLWGAPQNNIFVVGDEDQAIYGFRGADYRNVQRFRRDYPQAKTVLLEQNYRSTQIILDAARAVIDRNSDRTPKKLFTERQDRLRIYVHETFDEREEAEFIIKEIERLRLQGIPYNQMAVMYRTNIQSRAIEQHFVDYRIPYRLIGGVAFYSRREVKDMLAYLRLVDSGADIVSFDRVINTPKRGIGAKSLATFQAWADAQNLPYAEATIALAQGASIAGLPAKLNKTLAQFGEMLLRWRQLADDEQYVQLLDAVLSDTAYYGYLTEVCKTDTELAERQGNIEELKGLLAEHRFETLSDFLTDTALMSDADRRGAEQSRNVVTLLTLHASKGLEYRVVFLVGLEDGLLPHSRAFEEPDGIAEERRLFYVGITRAQDRLYLTRAFRRRLGQYADAAEPSRFLYDIPAELVEGSGHVSTLERNQQSYYRSTAWDATPPTPTGVGSRASTPRDEKIIPFPNFRVGMRVLHLKFGEGIVMESRIVGNDEEVTVVFEGQGVKRLMASFAKLEKLPG